MISELPSELNLELEAITLSTFSTMLGMELVRVESVDLPPEETLVASIQITGEWVGTVVLSLSTSAARAAAAGMLHMPELKITPADEQDVAAELSNIIGGNLKSLLPGPSSLSLPTVVAGREFGVRVYDAHQIEQIDMQSEGGCLQVRLYEKTSAQVS